VNPPFPKEKNAKEGASGKAEYPAVEPGSKPDPQVQGVGSPAGAFSDLPADAATIEQNRNQRSAYLEAREAVELEQKERKAAKEQLGKEIREICRPEIDEYVDCCVGRFWTIMVCKPEALRMRRCMKKQETPEYVERRMAEILASREASGESVVNNMDGRTRERRALYNRAILPKVDDAQEFTIRNDEPGAPKAAS